MTDREGLRVGPAAISEILRAFQQDLRDIQLAGVNWDELPPSRDSLNTKGKWMDLKRNIQGKRMEALRHSFSSKDKKPKELKLKINYLGKGTLGYHDWSLAIAATFMDRIGFIEAAQRWQLQKMRRSDTVLAAEREPPTGQLASWARNQHADIKKIKTKKYGW
ncbi:hypothetical protein BDZ91DRAFT_767402 [Kalaharituber pfeilii]|nr:hypothetical protein BDZ91DRAFT_767402 [Kalaharituber pfeilii]